MSVAVARSDVGLTAAEYDEIRARLGREPNPVELRCLGVMWSEHCAYKHSRETLRRLPTGGPRVLQGPGENAGVVEIGGGWALVWKMESHNHPSAVDPRNGAATGVGGIIRDVLSMGARPVALLDSLRFGPLTEPRSRRLLDGVVGGISGYGNCIGVPTVGGELAVDPAYRDNPLVNVACLGLVRADRVARGRADRAGAVFVCAGARTGRDGIGGAAFASDELDERSERDDRSAVQIGDPFAGKCLIEATLEALDTGRVLGIQDMGAGGLTCAASEMAQRGGRGAEIDLDGVPLREADMAGDEILLSESQERMLLVVEPADAGAIIQTYRRWGLEAAVVGTVTGDGAFRATFRGRTVVDIPVDLLAGAPVRRVAPVPVPAAAASDEPPVADPAAALLALLAAPEVASRRPIYEQYDHTVQIRTAVRPGFDAAVLRLPEVPPAGLALSADGPGRWCAVDPYGGALAGVLEAAANLACAGAEPLAVTDCLNFASPERGEVFFRFQQAVQGIADACAALGVPVVGGNVSFYNEGPGGGVLPTPVVAMAGLVPDVEAVLPDAREGDVLVLLGSPDSGLGGSLHARDVSPGGAFHRADVSAAIRAIDCARDAVCRRLVALAHDVSDGGLAVAAAECALAAGCGAVATLPCPAGPASALFGEGVARFVCAVRPERLPGVEALARERDVPLLILGRLGGDGLRITLAGRAGTIDLPLDRVREAFAALEQVVA